MPRSFSAFRLALLGAGLATALAAPAAAQAPFQDGELLVHAVPSGVPTFYRIDAATGHGEVLVQGHGYDGQAGWMAYDPARAALLVSCRFPAQFVSVHLFAVDAGGTVTSLGFQGQYLRALSSAGDGRVFFQRTAGAPHTLEWLDASNQVHALLDSATGLPLDLHCKFSRYVPETNALIVAGPSAIACAAPADFRVHRLQLSADGTTVLSSSCASWDFAAQNEFVNGLDRLPGGDLLLAVSHNYLGDQTLVRVDRATGALSLWAETTQGNLRGAVWSQRIGRAVVHDATFGDLRMFDAGHQSGPSDFGEVLALDVDVGGIGGGYIDTLTLVDVETFGPGCAGLAASYGTGLAGSGGFVPVLGAGNCPRLGATLVLTAASGRGGAPAVLWASLQPAALSYFGGTVLVAPPLIGNLAFGLLGSSGTPGAGTRDIPIAVPASPALQGVPVYCQLGVIDSDAAANVALSNGLEVRCE